MFSVLYFIVGVIVGGFISWQIAGRMAVRRISEFEHQVRLSRAGLRKSRT